MCLLYRGVSKTLDQINDGKLSPKGKRHHIAAKYDGKIKYDGKFNYGESEDNAVRAQQIESGLYDNSFISTSYNEDRAKMFATKNYTEEGFVYVINKQLFDEFNIISKAFSDPQYPYEEELSIRAADDGNIPNQVIVEKYEVDKSGNRKK